MKKNKLLYVISIILVIFGALTLLDVIESIGARRVFSSYYIDMFSTTGFVSLMILNILYGAAELTAGILGILSCQKPYKHTQNMIKLGVVMLVLLVITLAALIVLTPEISNIAINIVQEEIGEYDFTFPQEFFNTIADTVIIVTFVLSILIMAIFPTLYLVSAVKQQKLSEEEPDNSDQGTL